MRFRVQPTTIAAVACIAILMAWAVYAQEEPTPDIFDGLLDGPQWLTPQAAPESHDETWLQTHGIGMATSEQECSSCHTEETCADCHAGLIEPVLVHPPGFLTLHGPDALGGAMECATCHTETQFCVSCHSQSQVRADPDFRPVPSFAIHPDGWLDPTSAINHADEARMDLMQCASCHSADSCATCHVGISPHGDEFARRCMQMLNANAPTCADCHTGSSPLPFEMLESHPGCR